MGEVTEGFGMLRDAPFVLDWIGCTKGFVAASNKLKGSDTGACKYQASTLHSKVHLIF